MLAQAEIDAMETDEQSSSVGQEGTSDSIRQIATALGLPQSSKTALPLLRSINARVSEQLAQLGPALFSPLVPPNSLSESQVRTIAVHLAAI